MPTVEERLAALEQQPQIKPRLKMVKGDLVPLKDALKALKTSAKAVTVQPLMTGEYIMDRGRTRPSAGVNRENLNQVWSTLFHLRANDPAGMNMEALKADLSDLKSWLREDPEFLAAVNLDPRVAVLWFVDCWLAAAGEFDEDEDDD